MKVNKKKFHLKRTSKYNAKKTVVDGFTFDSKKEAGYYCELKIKQRIGKILMFLRQVPFHLPGGVVYRLDFLEFWKDGSVHFVDIKGYVTDLFIVKKKLVEALYNIEIELL